jgi:hypothetical protein
MPFPSIIPGFLIVLGILLPGQGFAVDPFSILVAGSAAVNLVGTVGGTTKDILEAGELISALDDLANETIPGSQDGSDPYRLANKIRRVEVAALEAGYTRDEVNSLLEDYRSSNANLTRGIKLITRSVRLSKRVALMAGLSSDKAAKAATIASAQSAHQDRKILEDIYGQLVSESLDQKAARIEQEKAQQNQFKRFRDYVLSVSKGKNIALFRVDNDLVVKAISVYRSYSWLILSLVAVIFFVRIVLYQFSFAFAEKYVDLIRDTMLCYFLMLALPYLFGYLGEYSDALAAKMSELLHVTGSTIPEKMIVDSSLLWWLRPEILPLILYTLVNVGFNLALSVLIALGPVAVLLGTMLNFSISLPAYFILILFAWMWPVFWNVLGYFRDLLWAQTGMSADGISSGIASIIFFLFQLISPAAIYSMIKQTHGGRAVSESIGSVKSAVNNYRTNREMKIREVELPPKRQGRPHIQARKEQTES